jgi:hypothetical protein
MRLQHLSARVPLVRGWSLSAHHCEELQKLGYLDGKNLVIDRRGAEGHNERLFSLISELIALGPDVIVAVGVPPTAAARRATSTIPIVMWGTNDPVGAGFIKSLAHPGGNVTGIAGMFADSIGKAVELLRAVLPTAKRMALGVRPFNLKYLRCRRELNMSTDFAASANNGTCSARQTPLTSLSRAIQTQSATRSMRRMGRPRRFCRHRANHA